MQSESVPESSPYGDYDNRVTSLDVFSRSLFAYPTSNKDAKRNDTVITIKINNHAFLTTTIVSVKESTSEFHVLKEMAGVLGIILQQAKKARTNNWDA